MTPAQQVALDAMRSAWPEETVARMLRAVDGRIEAALLLRAFGHKTPLDEGGLCVACGAWLGGRPDENHDHEDSCAWAKENALKWADAGFAANRLRAALPLVETSTGASTPQSDPRECSTCGNTGPHDCDQQ